VLSDERRVTSGALDTLFLLAARHLFGLRHCCLGARLFERGRDQVERRLKIIGPVRHALERHSQIVVGNLQQPALPHGRLGFGLLQALFVFVAREAVACAAKERQRQIELIGDGIRIKRQRIEKKTDGFVELMQA